MASSEMNKGLLGGYPPYSPAHTPVHRPVSQFQPMLPQPTRMARQKSHPTLNLQTGYMSPTNYNPREWPSIQLGIPQMSPTFNYTPVSTPVLSFSPRSVTSVISPRRRQISPISPHYRQSVDEYLEASQRDLYSPSPYSASSSSSSLYRRRQSSYHASPVHMIPKPPQPSWEQDCFPPPPPYSEKPTNTDSFSLPDKLVKQVTSFPPPPPPPPKDDWYRALK